MNQIYKKNGKSEQGDLSRGIFMFTLDTEIAWGMGGDKRWTKEFKGTRVVVRDLLALLDKYKISTTWAFVGQLLLSGEDRFYHAPELLNQVSSCQTRQEIGCHSFSHPVMDAPVFKPEDMDSELSKCAETGKSLGVEFKSFVFPQNRIAHIDRLSRHGFACFRGEDRNWYRALPRPLNKIGHVIDEYLGIAPPVGLPFKHEGVWELPGGYFYPHRRGWASLLPVSFRVNKAVEGLRKAKDQRRIFHLWTHPFNLASDPKNLLNGLEKIFKEAVYLRDQGQIEIMTMGEMAKFLDNAYE